MFLQDSCIRYISSDTFIWYSNTRLSGSAESLAIDCNNTISHSRNGNSSRYVKNVLPSHLVFAFKFVLEKGEPSKLPGELKGCQNGILWGKSYQGRRSQRPVRVYPAPGMPQGIPHSGSHALVAPVYENQRQRTLDNAKFINPHVHGGSPRRFLLFSQRVIDFITRC